jgi:quercetin dioxygenase-like cupin family protein
MDVYKLADMKAGWFVGTFEPSAFKTDACEVCYRVHPKGEVWDMHTHLQTTEINLVTQGHMRFQDRELRTGDVFVVHPWEISNPEFLEDTWIVCVRVPGIKNDKRNLDWK